MSVLELLKQFSKYIHSHNRDWNETFNMLKSNYTVQKTNPLLVVGRYTFFDDKEYDSRIVDFDYSEDKYYIYDECGHSGDWLIEEVNTLQDVEKTILDGGGYLNMYCTEMIVIKSGKKVDFRVYIIENDVKKYITGSEECNDDLSKAFVEWL